MGNCQSPIQLRSKFISMIIRYQWMVPALVTKIWKQIQNNLIVFLLMTGNRSDRHLRCTSPLYCLDPFLDEYDLLRVGGRLNKGSFCKDLKHPVILPRKSHVTELIISHFHNLKSNTRNIPQPKLRHFPLPDSDNHHLVQKRDLLAIFDPLHSHTFPDS